jgi:2-polyprenyl-6-methoxyphenol hydroxylase-like FAD-dependent oxidoreductase
MSHQDQPVIVGAGPVGLGAALFLAQQGRVARVVEMRDEPCQQSRALAVNPRTLDILEVTGVTSRMLELGSRIHGVRFYRHRQIIGRLSFAGMHPRYPFMLALSQATSERLLAEALASAGGEVERGLKMVECRNVLGRVEAVLEPTGGGPREVAPCPWLLAADGARSTARQQVGVQFVGSAFPREWHLADAPLRTQLADDHAHVFFLDGGAFYFMIRVVDETLNERVGQPVWRVMGNRPEPLSQLMEAELAGPPIWTSSFHVSHQSCATFSAGNVYFAGDAAHIHSPIGARGMNLGLEDAWVFAELVRKDRFGAYDLFRRRVDRRVVRRVELLSRLVSAESGFTRFLRAFVFPSAVKLPFVRGLMKRTVSGLDHELPDFLPPARAVREFETVKAGFDALPTDRESRHRREHAQRRPD